MSYPPVGGELSQDRCANLGVGPEHKTEAEMGRAIIGNIMSSTTTPRRPTKVDDAKLAVARDLTTESAKQRRVRRRRKP